MTFFKNMIRDEAGATAIEYGLIAALIAVAMITAVGAAGGEVSRTFTGASEGMAEVNDANAPTE
ncbi:Flp family type IVb pilin [Aurantiacibacter aquimixticola]|uniref:Flp family type IVb pilin n=1 Tax=Aurantiacibacter aquimixticola TaxID=1958945 RepID=A0A419RS73_9SPHN|nr:Flp family type IVb pilin [Aurantiacibacter aquimixticola]RJY08652.1 Flp family type IVb pilin [Aurantiacibacter aquimixticola]